MENRCVVEEKDLKCVNMIMNQANQWCVIEE